VDISVTGSFTSALSCFVFWAEFTMCYF